MTNTLFNTITLAFSSLALLLLGQPALAHEGHHSGGAANGVWHLLTQPDHWLLLFGLIATGLVVHTLVRLRNRRKAAAVRSGN